MTPAPAAPAEDSGSTLIGQVPDIHGDPVKILSDHGCVRVAITGATSADIAPARISDLTCYLAAGREDARAWSADQARGFADQAGGSAAPEPAAGSGAALLERLARAAYEQHMGKRKREFPWSALTPAGRQAWINVALAVLAAAGEYPGLLDAIPGIRQQRQDLARSGEPEARG